MSLLLAIVLFFADAAGYAEAQALQTIAPAYLSLHGAYLHLLAARYASSRYNVRPELLLAIAHHESNFHITTQTIEPGHRVSCGVMTPIPKQRCTSVDLGLYSGYAIGAAHLRTWLDYCHDNEICALQAYIGGAGLYRVCARWGRWTTPRGTNACNVAYQFRRDAKRIRQRVWSPIQT